MIPNRFRPTVEDLEGRLTPAICSVQFFSGLMVINGSALGDDITISQPSPGRITLTGGGSTTLRFGAATGAAVSVGSAFAPVRSITANLNTGDDVITFDQTSSISLAGSVKIDLGNGNNSLFQFGDQALSIGGSLTLLQGTGSVDVGLADFRVAGSTSISFGSGMFENVNFSTTPGMPNNRIGGNLIINTARGAKQFFVDNTDVIGGTSIFGGSNSIGFTNMNLVFSELNNGIATVNLNGGLIYTESPGNFGDDTIGLFDGTTVNNSVRITTFDGGSWIGFEGATVTRATTINELGPTGTNILAFSANYRDSVFMGAVNIHMGNGADSIAFSVDSTNSLTFKGAITGATGSGNDSIMVGGGGTSLHFDGGGVFNLGMGFDEVDCEQHTGFLFIFNVELPMPNPPPLV